MKLYLIRHAETKESRAGLVHGRLPGVISPEGAKQIRRLSLRLRDHPLTAVYSSTLERAIVTAQGIARPHKLPVYHEAALDERSFGLYDGKPPEEFWKSCRKAHEEYHLHRAPKGGQNYEDLQKQVRPFLERLVKEYEEESCIALVSHRSTIKTIIVSLLDLPLESVRGLQSLHASLTFLKRKEDHLDQKKSYWYLQLLNDISHLKAK